MFAKVFSQIFDSSLAEDYRVRFVFEDLLKLANSDGVVDMTHEAIARRTNVPVKMVRIGIAELEKPDPKSRTAEHEGRRILRLDDHRDWGWLIVNHGFYRNLASEEQRRAKTRERVRKHRCNANVTQCNAPVTQANDSPSVSVSSSVSVSEVKKKPSTEEEVIQYCTSKSLTKEDGEYFWNHWQSNGFTNHGKPIRDWQATIRAWKLAGHVPSQRKQLAIQGKPKIGRNPDELMSEAAWQRKHGNNF